MENNKDVETEDLYSELRKTLEISKESEAEEASLASEEKPTTESTVENENESEELSEDEISKLSPRAQKRIRDLAEQVKTIAEKEETPETPIDSPTPSNFKDVKEFLEAVQDEPSRKLLETFYGVIKAENSVTLAPIEKANNEAKFNEEFVKYEKIEGLSDYKNDLKQTFMRNPNQSLKSLISETVTDLAMNKLKPTEKKPSTSNHDGKVDISNLSKDQLYDMLETIER